MAKKSPLWKERFQQFPSPSVFLGKEEKKEQNVTSFCNSTGTWWKAPQHPGLRNTIAIVCPAIGFSPTVVLPLLVQIPLHSWPSQRHHIWQGGCSFKRHRPHSLREFHTLICSKLPKPQQSMANTCAACTVGLMMEMMKIIPVDQSQKLSGTKFRIDADIPISEAMFYLYNLPLVF